MTNSLELIDTQLATKSNEELLAMSAVLQGEQDEAGRAVRSCVIDMLITRFNISEIMDDVYYENLDFEGTIHEAILIAIEKVAA